MAAVQRPDPGIPGCRRLLCARSGQRAGGRGHVRKPLLAGAAGTNQPSPLALAVCCSPHKVSHSLPLPAALARDGAPPTGRKVGVQSSSKSVPGCTAHGSEDFRTPLPQTQGPKAAPWSQTVWARSPFPPARAGAPSSGTWPPRAQPPPCRLVPTSQALVRTEIQQ